MSAHLCKQIYASWRQTHDHTSTTSSSTIVSYDGSSHPAAASSNDDKRFYRISTSSLPSYKPYQRSSLSSQKRSMDTIEPAAS
ncbi:hypothetical protein Sste5344_006312 [Sporothrix stenoceras]